MQTKGVTDQETHLEKPKLLFSVEPVGDTQAHRHQWISLIPSEAFESDDEHFLAFQPSNVEK